MGSADDATDRAQIRSPTCLYKYLYSRALRDHFSLNCCSVIVFFVVDLEKWNFFETNFFNSIHHKPSLGLCVVSQKIWAQSVQSRAYTGEGGRGEERRSREKGERKEKKREGVGRTEGMQRHHEPRKNYLKASTFAEWPPGPVKTSSYLLLRLQASVILSPSPRILISACCFYFLFTFYDWTNKTSKYISS